MCDEVSFFEEPGEEFSAKSSEGSGEFTMSGDPWAECSGLFFLQGVHQVRTQASLMLVEMVEIILLQVFQDGAGDRSHACIDKGGTESQLEINQCGFPIGAEEDIPSFVEVVESHMAVVDFPQDDFESIEEVVGYERFGIEGAAPDIGVN